MFSLSHGKKVTLIKCFNQIIHVFHALGLVKTTIPLGQCEHLNQVGPSKMSHLFVMTELIVV